MHVSIVIVSTKDNVNLTKQLSDGFKRPVYWNNYQTIPATVRNQGTNIYGLHSASFQGVQRLFVVAYAIAADAANNGAGIKDNRKYFLPKGKIEHYSMLIDGRNFYDKPINNLIKQYDEVRRVSAGQDDDYTTGCLLDYTYFKNNYRLIAIGFRKQKALDADPRAIEQIVYQRAAGGDKINLRKDTKIKLFTILENSKETVLQFYKGTAKVLWEYTNGWIQ